MTVRRAQTPQAQTPQGDNFLELWSTLQKADPERMTNREFQQQLEESIRTTGEQPQFEMPKIFYSGDDELFLGNSDLANVYHSLERIEQNSLREAVDFLEEVIRRREAQDDLWPDGRLELGLAYAALGDYQGASRLLEEVIDICETGGKYRSQNIAMAA
jgi:tetratricopeptide (TPR) repeat protein